MEKGIPQLRSEILSPESGWTLQTKLKAVRFGDEQRCRYPHPQNGPSESPLDSPLSNDPQFQGFGGDTLSIQLRPRLRGYQKDLDRFYKLGYSSGGNP
jgi:hypothetical protein